MIDAAKPNIDNKSSLNERKILSRLILQKIMSSDAAKYLKKESYERIGKLLISENPDEEFNLNFRLNDSSGSYYSMVAEVSARWVVGEKEINDLDGNVWVAHTLDIRPTIGSSYSNTIEQFAQRADCIWQVNDMIEQITALVPGPIRVMSLNNEQRIVRDESRRKSEVSQNLGAEFRSALKKYRSGLRVGGRGRNVPREAIPAFSSILPGTYEFYINDGSKRSPRNKTYSATFPHNYSYPIMIKRTK